MTVQESPHGYGTCMNASTVVVIVFVIVLVTAGLAAAVVLDRRRGREIENDPQRPPHVSDMSSPAEPDRSGNPPS